MIELAEHQAGEPHLFGWWVGLIIGFVIVAIVVVVVSAILTLASRISRQAQEAIAALDASRVSTLPLWDVQKIQGSSRGILDAARAARAALGG